METLELVKLPVCYTARPDMELEERIIDKRKDDGGASILDELKIVSMQWIDILKDGLTR